MFDSALICLALTIFFEARGEPIQGQLAVAEVVLNRKKSSKYPNTVCEVVTQENGVGCQFSFWCDGLSDQPTDAFSFKRSKALAKLMIEEGEYISVVGGNVTHYHTEQVQPYWSEHFTEVDRIGNHIFYANIKALPRPDIFDNFFHKPLKRPDNLIPE